MRDEATSKKVVRNTLFNYLAVFSTTLINLVAMPIIIHGLGDARFGIYVTIMSVVGYVALLDMGIGTSLTKFVAEYEAKKDFQRLNEIFSTAFILYIGLGLLGGFLLIAFSDVFIQRIFQIPQELWGEAHYVFWISAASLFSGLTLGIFANILGGIQRHDIWRTISIVTSFISAVGGIILVLIGYKLVAYTLFLTLTSILGFLVQMVYAKRLLPEVHLVPRHFKIRELKAIVNFTFAIFVNQLAVRNMGSLDRLIVGIFLPIRNVTLYSIGLTLVMFCFKIPSAAALAFTPAASELHAKNRMDAIQELVLRGMKYTGLFAIPIFTVLGILAKDVLYLWMGEGYDSSAVILQLLMIGYFWLVLSSSGMTVMVGIGKPYINSLYALAQIGLCTALTLLMIHLRGLFGAAMGSGLAFAVGGIIYIFHSSHIFGIPVSRLLSPPMLLKSLLLVVPGGVLFVVHHSMPSRDLLVLLIECTTYGFLYAFIVLRYLIDDYDIEKISGVLPPVRYLSFLRRSSPFTGDGPR